MITQEQAAAALKKHGTKAAAARALGVPRQTFCDRLAGAREATAPTTKAQPTAPTPQKPGRSLSEFRATYDKAYIVPRKIKEAIAKLGGGSWLYEMDFAKLAGVSLADLGNFRSQFEQYVVATREKRAWAGSIATAEQMRAML